MVEVVLGHQHHLVDHREHGLDGLGDRDAGGGVGGRGVDGSLLVEGVLHAAGAFRAHTDDADVRKIASTRGTRGVANENRTWASRQMEMDNGNVMGREGKVEVGDLEVWRNR